MTAAAESARGAALLRLAGVGAAHGGRPVLDAIDLELRAGALVALVGRNGAGKTTLLRIAAGLVPPGRGTVELEGRALASRARREIARSVAYLPQSETGAEVELTVREVVALGRLAHGSPFSPLSAVDRAAVDRAIDDAGLRDLDARPLSALSAGERQRALLARAFAHESRLLLLDEPTASLDPARALELVQAVRARVGTTGAALVAMHDLFLVARTADRVLVLDGGGIVADGPPDAVLDEATLERAFGLRARLAREDGELVLRARAD